MPAAAMQCFTQSQVNKDRRKQEYLLSSSNTTTRRRQYRSKTNKRGDLRIVRSASNAAASASNAIPKTKKNMNMKKKKKSYYTKVDYFPSEQEEGYDTYRPPNSQVLTVLQSKLSQQKQKQQQQQFYSTRTGNLIIQKRIHNPNQTRSCSCCKFRDWTKGDVCYLLMLQPPSSLKKREKKKVSTTTRWRRISTTTTRPG